MSADFIKFFIILCRADTGFRFELRGWGNSVALPGCHSVVLSAAHARGGDVRAARRSSVGNNSVAADAWISSSVKEFMNRTVILRQTIV